MWGATALATPRPARLPTRAGRARTCRADDDGDVSELRRAWVNEKLSPEIQLCALPCPTGALLLDRTPLFPPFLSARVVINRDKPLGPLAPPAARRHLEAVVQRVTGRLREQVRSRARPVTPAAACKLVTSLDHAGSFRERRRPIRSRRPTCAQNTALARAWAVARAAEAVALTMQWCAPYRVRAEPAVCLFALFKHRRCLPRRRADMNRTWFIIRAYLRTRLAKACEADLANSVSGNASGSARNTARWRPRRRQVETHVVHILNSPPLYARLSHAEKEYAHGRVCPQLSCRPQFSLMGATFEWAHPGAGTLC